MRRCDDQGSPIQMPRQQGGHECPAQPDDIREKHPAELIEHPRGVQHRVFLVFEFLEIVREIRAIQLVRQIEFVADNR